MRVKGVVAAGGTGSRMAPSSRVLNKHFLPIYDKPMIYYPIAALMLAGIRQVLLVAGPSDLELYRHLLGDGSQWGIEIQYAIQKRPKGIAEVLSIAQAFTSEQPYALVLGDNLFHGKRLTETLRRASARLDSATILGCSTARPSEYAVAQLGTDGRVVELEEKPARPQSPWAVTGLYFYDARAAHFAAALRPSRRAELEITDINRRYLEAGALHFEPLASDDHWFDAGTPESLLAASNFVHAEQRRERTLVGCPAWVAARAGWIDAEAVRQLAGSLSSTPYGRQLLECAGAERSG